MIRQDRAIYFLADMNGAPLDLTLPQSGHFEGSKEVARDVEET
jgi:hypothetical protein